MVQSCVRGGSDVTCGSISLPRGWSDTGTGFLERWSMPRACQCLKKRRGNGSYRCCIVADILNVLCSMVFMDLYVLYCNVCTICVVLYCLVCLVLYFVLHCNVCIVCVVSYCIAWYFCYCMFGIVSYDF